VNVGALNLKNISVRGLINYSFLIAFDTLVHAEGCHFSHIDANVGSAILFQQFAELSQLQTLHVTDCVFEHISAEISAGAIFISSEQNMEALIENSSFTNVSSMQNGGVVYAAGAATLTMDHLSVSECASRAGSGSFAFIQGMNVKMNDVQVQDCESEESTIYVQGSNQVTIEHSTFKNLSSQLNGGVVRAQDIV
jgi:hypothetical protein